METVCALLVGAMVAASVYLMLARDLIRFIFGLVLAGNAVNLLVFTVGRLAHTTPPLLPAAGAAAPGAMANALSQALVLTAIVIGFALLCFVFVLFYRAYQTLGTVDTERMQAAEGGDAAPPSGGPA